MLLVVTVTAQISLKKFGGRSPSRERQRKRDDFRRVTKVESKVTQPLTVNSPTFASETTTSTYQNTPYLPITTLYPLIDSLSSVAVLEMASEVSVRKSLRPHVKLRSQSARLMQFDEQIRMLTSTFSSIA